MPSALRTLLLLIPLASCVPAVFQGETLAGGRDCCCRVCRCPVPQCTCVTPTIVPQAALQQRDVMVTEYRNEAVAETVPATVYENVMVDEGSYQTVWVPKLTTKAVARTSYQTRTTYRTVPYQVSRRITEYATQTGSYQTGYYTPNSTLAYGASPVYSLSSLPYSTAASLPYGTAPQKVVNLPVLTRPSVASTLNSSTGIRPVPEPRLAEEPATPISPRSAMRYDDQSTASRLNDNSSVNRGPSLFSPTPSAAQVWRTPRGTMTR